MVGVAEAGGGPGVGPEPFSYGEYYPPDHYFVTPEMCPHPQHPQHPHMCAIHSEYGGVGMPVVTSGTMMQPMLGGPVIDENGAMRHYLMPHPAHAPHPGHPPHPPHQQHPPHPQQHHQPPHHQPPHHYGPANGGGGPQQYYPSGGYPPAAHYHHMPPQHLQPSPPPPPLYHKDERSQRQYTKLKRRLDQKHNNRNNGIDFNSGGSTPSLSPRKDTVNGNKSGNGGTWSEGEGSSAATSVQGDDDDTQSVLDILARTPQVSEITSTSALVQWNSPTPEGVTLPSTELTYELLLGDRDRYKAIYSGPSLSCRVRDLRPGTEYSVCLQIRAGGITGAASGAATFRAPAASPCAPPPARVTQRTRTTLLLRWGAAPENGARILNYIVEMDAGAGWTEVAKPRTRQLTANNLQQQTEHRFRIAAVNECGRGPWGEELTVWTAGAPPTAPQPPELSAATNNSLLLAWERRTSEEEFTLQMNDRAGSHGFLPVYSGRDLQHLCDGLRRSSNYSFRLRCETADGNGPWSTEVMFRTSPERPGPPGRPVAKGKIHSRAFRLRWDPPTDNGGAEVCSYTLELDSGEGFLQAYTGPEREAHCDRLQPGMPYRARVNCATEAGTSDWSSTETVTTEAMCPGSCPVPELTGKPRASSIAVRWKTPESDGGSPITEYRLELYEPSGETRVAYTGPDLECVVRDLTPGTEYKLQVIAYNRVGAGAVSPQLSLVTAPAPPDAPEALSAQIETPYSALLEWLEPSCNGAPIIDYKVEMSNADVDDTYTEIYRGLGTSYIVKKLVPSSPYFFRVCASNAAGRGQWSRVSPIVTPRAPPAAPSGIRHESTAVSLDIVWRKPVDHGAEILRYMVKLADTVYETDGPVCTYLIEGLSPETQYEVRVAAINELGVGEWSEVVKMSTRPPPPLPPQLECVQRAHNFIKIKWGEGTAPESTQYCLEMRAPESRDFRPTYRGSARSCKVKKLREYTTYTFRIRASDELGGRGKFSEPFEASTNVAPPPAPRAPTVEMIATRVAVVHWEPLELHGSENVSYIVQTGRGKDPMWKQAYVGPETRAELDELEGGGEYWVRVCGVRAGLHGAWSVGTRLQVPAPPPLPSAVPRTRRARSTRSLVERHAVWLIIIGFILLAWVMAIVVEQLVDLKRVTNP